ncbi:unnamed protein product [Euphydryas editha]|uniref:G-patch domain-containing protein n=1 Tax=Euphydryas editha TaxID=104508 RepID=A0AAU9TGV5_EUPED|nr:unnamed protein product [Euphydryas editha]
MNDIITESFKVQWLKMTLKFVNNHNRMIIKYPKMPLSHIEYLKNIFYKHECMNDVNMSFYTPLWKAMKTFSWKIIINVSENANTGQLIIEKISNSTVQENDKVDIKVNSVNHVADNSSRPISKKLTSKQSNESQKKETNDRIYFLNKRGIIDSLSHSFLQKSLQKILDFISTEAEASVIFTDLAPKEARFLENFLGIYKRRDLFKTLMSPVCNDILNKMYTKFKDKTLKLEIGGAKINKKTKKREVTFIKVPRYVRPTMPRTLNTSDINKNEQTNEIRVSLENIKLDVTMNTENAQTRLLRSIERVLNSPKLYSDRPDNDIVLEENNTKNIKVQSIENIEETTNFNDPSTVEEKSALLCYSGRENETKDSEKETSPLSSTCVVFDKVNGYKLKENTKDLQHNDIEENFIEYWSPRIVKLAEDLSLPVKSEKGLRIMQRMGWSGGALGPHGNGISEPIFPALDQKRRAGLGHKPEKSVLDQSEIDLCNFVLQNLLNMFKDNVSEVAIQRDSAISVKESKCLSVTLKSLNDRFHEDVTFLEGIDRNLANEALEQMFLEPNTSIKIAFSRDNK